MRWIPFAILTFVIVCVQTTIGRVLVADIAAIGAVGPDLLAVVAVFFAFGARDSKDAMLAGWVLGMSLDLTTGGGAAVGPMAIAYVVAAWTVCRMRPALFRERVLTQILATMLFVAVAHGLWLVMQSLLGGAQAWRTFGPVLLQVLAAAAYTAVLAPLGFYGLRKVRRWFLTVPAGRSRSRV